MIRIKSDPENKKVYFDLDNLSNKHRKAIRKASYDIGALLKNTAQKQINNSGRSGRAYPFNGGTHIASAPGQPPAKMTGKLKESIDYDVRGYQEIEYGYKINYGEFLEDGTRKMERRPNLRRVADNKAQTFVNFLVRALREVK